MILNAKNCRDKNLTMQNYFLPRLKTISYTFPRKLKFTAGLILVTTDHIQEWAK